MNRAAASGRLWAGWGLDPRAGLLQGILVQWEGGRFTSIESRRRPPADLEGSECHPGAILTPGLLNAHGHLDDSWLEGALPAGVEFTAWLREMIRARGERDPSSAGREREACARQIEAMAGDGIIETWDIDSLGTARPLLDNGALAGISFDEIIAPTRLSWEERGRARFREHKTRAYLDSSGETRQNGLSPHAPYTMIPLALETCARWAARRSVPLAIHLAESEAENRLLIDGEGPLLDLMAEVTGASPADELGVGPSPIERARLAGALRPSTLAVHCNLPGPGEVDLLARQRVAIVYCPSSHAWFAHPPYPLEQYLAAGARIALGTDGLACNRRLSIRAEAGRAAAAHPTVEPLVILALATGALLGLEPPLGGRGLLAPGVRAGWALWAPGSVPANPTDRSMVECWLDESTRLIASSTWGSGPA